MEQIIKIAICDDEKSTLEIIKNITKTIFADKNLSTSIETFLEPKSLLEVLAKERMNLIFLDIELNKEDGIEVAKEISNMGMDTKIVFISSHEERVFDSLKTHPYGFVRKNNFIKDFTFVINSYLSEDDTKEIEHKLVLKGKNTRSLDIKNITYIESDGKYQIIHLTNPDSTITVRENMNDFENELITQGFIRTHKCYLVNSEYIKVINNEDVTLKDDNKLIISKRKAQDIRNKYLAILKNKKQAIVINKK